MQQDPDVPPGYYIDPDTGQLKPIQTAQPPGPTSQPGLGPGQTPTNPYGWDQGAPAPSSAPPGMHWDANLANFVPDTPGGTTNPPTQGPNQPPGPNLTDPFNQTYTPPSPVNLGGPGGIPYIPPTPVFTPPTYTPPPAFQAPTANDVLNDPGYQFRLDQGQQSLQNARAAQGTLNTGSTLKDILGYGQDYASNEFQNVFNRDLTQYNTNYQTQYTDPYNIAFQGATAAFAPQMTGYQTQAAAGQHQNDANYTNSWNQFLFDYNKFVDQRDSTFNKNYQVATAP